MADLFAKHQAPPNFVDEVGRSSREILVDASRFGCVDVCRDTTGSLGNIRFTADIRDQVASNHIFWGPYIAASAGVYLITINGFIDGRAVFDFAHHTGSIQIKQVTLDNFGQPICLVLNEHVSDLEMRALKSSNLHSMMIESVSFSCAYLAGS